MKNTPNTVSGFPQQGSGKPQADAAEQIGREATPNDTYSSNDPHGGQKTTGHKPHKAIKMGVSKMATGGTITQVI